MKQLKHPLSEADGSYQPSLLPGGHYCMQQGFAHGKAQITPPVFAPNTLRYLHVAHMLECIHAGFGWEARLDLGQCASRSERLLKTFACLWGEVADGTPGTWEWYGLMSDTRFGNLQLS